MTGRLNRHGTVIDTLFVLMLFCVFAVSVLFVLLSGAGVYRDTAEVIDDRYEKRVCVSYLSSKMRHYDTEGGLSIGKLGDTQALILTENYMDEIYITYIYYYDGYICELYTGVKSSLRESAGERIIPARGLEFDVNESDMAILKILYNDDTFDTIYTYINSGGGISK